MANISIFGLGYVGCVGIGCLAQKGHQLIGVDPQASKVEFINSGKATIVEAGIEQLIGSGYASGKIKATTDPIEAVLASEVSFICVGTPPTSTGHLDLTAIRHVASQIGTALKNKGSGNRHIVAIRSTVLPGTADEVAEIIVKASGRILGEDFAVVSNPEFLREGSAITDFNSPPFTLVGSEYGWATEIMQEIYAGVDAPFIAAKLPVAELMKYVCNSFHALKITFANEVGNICKKLGIDSHELMGIFCRDNQLNISKAYLKPGFAYGGSCLPKDLKGLCTIAHDHYLETPLLDNIARSNEFQKEIVLKRILEYGKQNVSFLGLAFKAGTDDLRESPIVDVIERLLGKGFKIRIYDPQVQLAKLTGANRDYILNKIPFISEFITDNLGQVLDHGDTIVVVNRDDKIEEAIKYISGKKKTFELTRLSKPDKASSVVSEGISW